MKKIVILVIVFAFVFLIPTDIEAQEIKIVIDGKEKEFAAEPFFENKRTMVPMRDIFEILEYNVSWETESRTAVGAKNGKEIRFSVGSYFPLVDESPIYVDAPTLNYEGRTFVPLRILGEFSGSTVEWDDETNTIFIDNSNNKEYLPSYLGKNINVNTASKEKLIKLDEISNAEAKNIISYRNSKGPFLKEEDLLNVPGIDEAILQNISKDIYVIYIETGTASWYGSKFHGNRTASGSIYNMYELTAAHKTLPFGTKVNVICLNSSKNVTVTINDRGPHISGRIIDLSYAASNKIGITGPGLGEVKLEVLGED